MNKFHILLITCITFLIGMIGLKLIEAWNLMTLWLIICMLMEVILLILFANVGVDAKEVNDE